MILINIAFINCPTSTSLSQWYRKPHITTVKPYFVDINSSPSVDVCCVCCPQSIKVYLPKEPGLAQKL